MDYRRANRAYLYMILSTIGVILVLSLWYVNGGGMINIIANNVISESVIVLPVIAAVLYSGEKLSVLVPIKKIKLPSLLLTMIYLCTLFPLVSFVNAFSMLFVENTVSEISDEVLAMPMWAMILSIGIFGPFVEEFVFRGVLLSAYQRTGRIIGSIVLSSVLFGMMHMNFNQFAYGTVMGIMLALLVEATGSVLTSFIAHAVFNTFEVVMMYATADFLSDATDMAQEYIDELGVVFTVVELACLFVMAAIFTTIAVFIARGIASIEGRGEFFANIPRMRRQGYKLVTIPVVIAMVISVSYMVLYAFL